MGKTRKRNYDNFYRRRQGISTRSILLLLKAQSLPKRKCQTRYNYNLKIVKKKQSKQEFYPRRNIYVRNKIKRRFFGDSRIIVLLTKTPTLFYFLNKKILHLQPFKYF